MQRAMELIHVQQELIAFVLFFSPHVRSLLSNMKCTLLHLFLLIVKAGHCPNQWAPCGLPGLKLPLSYLLALGKKLVSKACFLSINNSKNISPLWK